MAAAKSRTGAEPVQAGYARVSTDDQTVEQQVHALEHAGCSVIYRETASGKTTTRAELQRMLVELQPGDSVTVWKLDRLGRSLIEVVTIIDQLGKQGIGFKSLTEQIDTTSAGGRLMMHMVAAFAEFERSLIIERTKAGQARAVREGRKLGRRRSLTPAQEREIRRQVDAGEATKADLARLFNVHASTITRLMERSA